MKKDENLRKRLEAEKAKEQPQKQSWSSWIWGSSEQSTSQSDEDAAFGGSNSISHEVADDVAFTFTIEGIHAEE